MRVLFGLLAFAVLTAAAPANQPEHDAPFFPERMRTAMEWVDRERHRQDPFLLLTFREFDAPATVNRTRLRDHLIGYDAPPSGFGGVAGPGDGATYGFMVGKDTWTVVYDAVHRLAYYGEGCCAFGYGVLMRTTTAAPPSVPRRDLSRMRTVRGIRLGMNARQVQAREGPAPRALGPSRSGRTALVYTTTLGPRNCVEQRTFVFGRGRLEAIDVLRGC
jgi:hypothetical protein